VRKVRIPIRGLRGARVKSVTVHATGLRARKLRGRRSSVRVSLVRRRTDSNVRVTLVVKAGRHGRKVTLRVRRTYRTCAKVVA
jgi:hypothetical protein